MAKESERMRRLKAQFMELHEQGFSISEIAKNFNLSARAVYGVLQKIADANGVTRASLLQVVRTPTERAYQKEVQKVNVDVRKIEKQFKEARNTIEQLINTINTTLEEERNNGIYD